MVSRSRKVRTIALFAVLVALVNLPLLQTSLQAWRLQQDGRSVTATVTGTDSTVEGGDAIYWVSYRLPEDNPGAQATVARVDRATYERAVSDATVTVKVDPDQPLLRRVDGQVTGRMAWWLTLAADALLAAGAFAVGRSWRRLAEADPEDHDDADDLFGEGDDGSHRA